jgi:hypothetical protein
LKVLIVFLIFRQYYYNKVFELVPIGERARRGNSWYTRHGFRHANSRKTKERAMAPLVKLTCGCSHPFLLRVLQRTVGLSL